MAGRVENLKPFKKNDPRINRNGRPKSFDALRKLAQQIATEDVKQNGQILVIDGHKVTVIEAVMRALASSKNPRDRELFLKYAYGTPPATVEVSGKGGGPVVMDHTHKLAEVSDDDIERTLAALGRSALAASGRTPVHDDSGGAEGEDTTGEEE